jgi:hypothetical protein
MFHYTVIKQVDHVILCSTFDFLFDFQVVRTSDRSKFDGPLYL